MKIILYLFIIIVAGSCSSEKKEDKEQQLYNERQEKLKQKADSVAKVNSNAINLDSLPSPFRTHTIDYQDIFEKFPDIIISQYYRTIDIEKIDSIYILSIENKGLYVDLKLSESQYKEWKSDDIILAHVTQVKKIKFEIESECEVNEDKECNSSVDINIFSGFIFKATVVKICK